MHLRKDKLQAPIAGVSHWRREPEFCAAAGSAGSRPDRRPALLDAATWVGHPSCGRMLWSPAAGGPGRQRDRQTPRPTGRTSSASGATRPRGPGPIPHEAADFLLGCLLAATEDWDALVRRGSSSIPTSGAKARRAPVAAKTSTRSPRSSTAAPGLRALAARRVALASQRPKVDAEPDRAADGRKPGGAAAAGGSPPAGTPSRGRLVIDTPYTQGSPAGSAASPSRSLTLEFVTDNPFAVVVATSIGDEPIATPTGCSSRPSAGSSRPASAGSTTGSATSPIPGRPPLLQEPVMATVVWRRKGTSRPTSSITPASASARLPLETARQDGDG